MLKRVLVTAAIPLFATIGTAALTGQAVAKDSDAAFFEKVEGEWNGPGEIVAGKYKGTKFNCSFTGSTPNGQVGMALNGSCRVGMFAQKMSASVKRRGRGTIAEGSSTERPERVWTSRPEKSGAAAWCFPSIGRSSTERCSHGFPAGTQ